MFFSKGSLGSVQRVPPLFCATFLFLACSGEGSDGGSDDEPNGTGGQGDCVGDGCTTSGGAGTGGTGSGSAPATGGSNSGGGSGGEAVSSTGGENAGSGGAGTGGAETGSGGAETGGSDPGTGGEGPATGGSGSGGISGTGGSDPADWPFLIGADITHTMEDEYWGATYTDGGVQKPLEVILKEHGFNAARIDTFVDPSAPGGYAETEPAPFRGIEQTITLAQRVKAQGMYFLLDLHMSDTWTNPGAQTTPNAWAGYSLSQLEDAVTDYVTDALGQLIAEGARPDIVQFGNEITNGMMWETGRITNDDFSNFAALLKAGISGIKAVDDSIVIMLHIEKCNNLATTRWWLDGVLGEGVEFDVLGQSCYGPTDTHAGYQGMPSEWENMFGTIASEYPELKFAIAEYSSEQRAANDVIFNLPNNRGIGTFNWDPTRAYETHPNDPLFSMAWPDFTVIPQQMDIYEQMAADYAAAGR